MKDPRNFHEKCQVCASYCKRFTSEGIRSDEGTCEDCEWYETMDEDGYVLDEYDTDEGVDFFGWNSEW